MDSEIRPPGEASSLLLPRTKEHMRGACRILTGQPVMKRVGPAYYLPHREEGNWGLFDAQDAPVELAVERGFADMVPLRQIPESTTRYAAIEAQLPSDSEYIYGGRFVHHFGHFLIETLARFWPFTEGFRPDQRIVMHGDGDPDQWFALRHVRELFGALGLRRDAIVHADAPFRIDTILVTEPAFRPQAQGYPDFVRFCRQLGARLMEAAPPPPRLDRPVYLTKSGLAAGVARWQNEAELEAALQRRGFAIIHPQDLTLAEHLRLYASGATIYGVIGSAHHVSLFAPAPVRFKLLAPERLNANFFLIDDLTGNDSTYHFAQGTHNVPNTGAPFIVERVIPEPEQVADALCAAL
ncbi:hypothetical protein BHAOGJBA_6220 [Methylobacterium hispanicum]|jgi:hypothetical protein|uniref:Glycosyltransferase 61 catalytic domain-containing protein n=1 Tax=Methylobacterium hispanicum TaxID=270350 RepID=A0AAV4ZXE0_9HYPH|nr:MULTISPECIES: glycosyltransferase 61 family protein [Methylobacterium]GJD92664.1 hypothetical protein BHAOGJBA_6220 [Methylobacterium hispanicum]